MTSLLVSIQWGSQNWFLLYLILDKNVCNYRKEKHKLFYLSKQHSSIGIEGDHLLFCCNWVNFYTLCTLVNVAEDIPWIHRLFEHVNRTILMVLQINNAELISIRDSYPLPRCCWFCAHLHGMTSSVCQPQTAWNSITPSSCLAWAADPECTFLPYNLVQMFEEARVWIQAFRLRSCVSAPGIHKRVTFNAVRSFSKGLRVWVTKARWFKK